MLCLIIILTNLVRIIRDHQVRLVIKITILNKLDKEFCKNKIMKCKMATAIISTHINRINKIQLKTFLKMI